MRLAILAACADTFSVLIDGLYFEPHRVDEFSKRRASLALRQPAPHISGRIVLNLISKGQPQGCKGSPVAGSGLARTEAQKDNRLPPGGGVRAGTRQ